MILQELIRNYILYREVLKPVLTSWRDSLANGYNSKIVGFSSSDLSLAIHNATAGGDGDELGWDISDEYEARSINQISGTHTITIHEKPSVGEFDLFYTAQSKPEQVLISKGSLIVLVGSRVHESVVNTGKTSPQVNDLGNTFIMPALIHSMSATTGFESKQIKSFLRAETHEKREYLGEFSLTHEEIPLLYQLEGGEYHDIN